MRITQKLLLYVLAPGFACSLTAGIFGLLTISGGFEKEAVERARLVLEKNVSEISAFCDSRFRILSLLTDIPVFSSGNLTERRAALAAFTPKIPEAEALYWDEPDGTVYPAKGPSFNISDRPYFASMHRGEPVITSVISSRATGKHIILMLQPVFTQSASLRGAIAAAVPVDSLIAKIEAVRVGKRGFAVFLGIDGSIGDKRLADTPLAKRLTQTASEKPEGHFKSPWNGRNLRVDYSRVPGSPFLVAIMSDEEELFANARNSAIAVFIISFLFTLLIAWIFNVEYRGLVVPLKEILKAMNLFSGGDRKIRIRPYRHDETDDLANAFNRMAEALARAERETRDSEERYREIFDNSNDNIFLLDVTPEQRFRIRMINPAQEKVLHLKSADISGHFVDDAVSPDLAEMVTRNYRRCVESGEPQSYDESAVLNGELLNYRTSIFPIRNPEGRIDRIIGISHDITERTRAENQLKNSEAELRRLNDTLEERVRQKIEEVRKLDAMLIQQARVAAMGEMLSDISHHWRQPLNVISVIIQNIRYRFLEGGLSAEYLDLNVGRAMSVAEGMSKTIDHFRQYLFPSDSSDDSTDINNCILSALSLSEPFFTENGIRTVYEPSPGGESPVKLSHPGAPQELVQVFVNLFGNCRDIFLERKTTDPFIHIKTKYEPHRLTVTVSDNAGGIPAGMLPLVFNPYFSTKRQLQGAGLGLYISRLIVENRFGGTIEAANDPQGAVFTLALPISEFKSKAKTASREVLPA